MHRYSNPKPHQKPNRINTAIKEHSAEWQRRISEALEYTESDIARLIHELEEAEKVGDWPSRTHLELLLSFSRERLQTLVIDPREFFYEERFYYSRENFRSLEIQRAVKKRQNRKAKNKNSQRNKWMTYIESPIESEDIFFWIERAIPRHRQTRQSWYKKDDYRCWKNTKCPKQWARHLD